MNEKQKKLKKLSKGKRSSYLKDAEYRIKNRKWLTYSSNIARRILAALADQENFNQKKLASTIKVSPQYICKVVKGKENLSLETIAKLSDALNVELITFASYRFSPSSKPEFSTVLVGLGAVAIAVNSPYPNYTELHNILSIDSDAVIIPQKSFNNDFFSKINPNIEKQFFNNENYSLIKQSSQNE